MWEVVFPQRLFEDMRSMLFSNAPSENGCFLLANSYTRSKDRQVMLITEMTQPSSSSWKYGSEHSLEPSSSFINDAVVRADSSNLSVLFVHTHPNPLHPTGFSPIDKHSNNKLFATISEILPKRPVGSLVLSRSGIDGDVFANKKLHRLSRVSTVGRTISVLERAGAKPAKEHADARFDRQIKSIGKTRHAQLRRLSASVVGVGGTGSAVAIQLARMGLGQLRLVDMDTIDRSNLSRVYGSRASDIGKAKVDVIKRHIAGFSDAKIDTRRADITKRNMVPDLVDSDVIFGCTDNLASRAILNDISVQYCIPLIDVGCRILLNKDDSINQAVVKVQVVTPANACLWCTGTLNGVAIMQESLPESEKKKLAEEGYYKSVGKQPSIISITTLAGSVAVNKLLNLLGVFGQDYSTRTQLELRDNILNDDTPPISEKCVCRKRVGLADERRIVN